MSHLGAGENPKDRQFEAATRAFILRVIAHNVEFKGFTFRAAAGTEIRAAIDLQGNNARLENCLVEWNAGLGIKILGNDCVLKKNAIRNNGQQGLAWTMASIRSSENDCGARTITRPSRSMTTSAVLRRLRTA